MDMSSILKSKSSSIRTASSRHMSQGVEPVVRETTVEQGHTIEGAGRLVAVLPCRRGATSPANGDASGDVLPRTRPRRSRDPLFPLHVFTFLTATPLNENAFRS